MYLLTIIIELIEKSQIVYVLLTIIRSVYYNIIYYFHFIYGIMQTASVIYLNLIDYIFSFI